MERLGVVMNRFKLPQWELFLLLKQAMVVAMTGSARLLYDGGGDRSSLKIEQLASLLLDLYCSQ